MKPVFTSLLLVVAVPAMAQVPEGKIPDGGYPKGHIPDGWVRDGKTPDDTAKARNEAREQPSRSETSGQAARSAYGYRLTAPEEDEDPSDRRVLRRLNTRLNNRLETRIERYKSIDTKSDRTGVTTRNPYEPKPATEADKTDPILKKRPPEDPR